MWIKKGIIIKMALATQITTQHFSFTLAVAVTGAQVTHYILKVTQSPYLVYCLGIVQTVIRDTLHGVWI